MERSFLTPRAYERIKEQTNREKEKAIESINRYPLTAFITLRKNRQRKYICPICHSGENGRHNTSGFSISRENRVTCFANDCFASDRTRSTDTLGAICIIEGITPEIALQKYIGFDWRETFNQIKDDEERGTQTKREYKPTGANINVLPMSEREKLPEALKDISGEIISWIDNLKGCEKAKTYLRSRGLSTETIERYRLGYDNDGYITIPYNNNYFIRRSIWNNDSGMKYRKPLSSEYGREPLFGVEHLSDKEPIFIVEGTFDAMSIYQSGGKAIALNTTGKPSNFIFSVENMKTDDLPRFIVALDDDEIKDNGTRPGQDGQKRLCEFLDSINARYIEYDLSTPYKDANELLINAPSLLRERVCEAKKKAEAIG